MIPTVTLVLLLSSLQTVLPLPQNGNSNTRDLKYTFKNEGEIPAGFFDAPSGDGMRKRSPYSQTEPQGYAACQDGSGGMCIPEGKCGSNDKAPPTPGRVSCDPGQECCYSGPVNSSSPCRDKGGECTAPPRSCGRGPQIRSGTECDHSNGEICCIWTF